MRYPLLLLLLACTDAIGPGTPWDPPAGLWSEVAACSDLPLPAADRMPRWFIVSGGSTFVYTSSVTRRPAIAYAINYVDRNYVRIAEGVLADDGRRDPVIRHEMLHELLWEHRGDRGHPLDYFADKCGPLVYPVFEEHPL